VRTLAAKNVSAAARAPVRTSINANMPARALHVFVTA
jgi:hypothetical protein